MFGAVQIIWKTLGPLSLNNTWGGRGLTKVSRDIFLPFSINYVPLLISTPKISVKATIFFGEIKIIMSHVVRGAF